jgi:hypothetical protein
MLVPVGFGRGRTTVVGGALGTLVGMPDPTDAERAAVGMEVATGVASPVAVPLARGAVVVGWFVAHAWRSAGEIMPAPITTDRATSFMGERPR